MTKRSARKPGNVVPVAFDLQDTLYLSLGTHDSKVLCLALSYQQVARLASRALDNKNGKAVAGPVTALFCDDIEAGVAYPVARS